LDVVGIAPPVVKVYDGVEDQFAMAGNSLKLVCPLGSYRVSFTVTSRRFLNLLGHFFLTIFLTWFDVPEMPDDRNQQGTAAYNQSDNEQHAKKAEEPTVKSRSP
jgi:hypothetical protein